MKTFYIFRHGQTDYNKLHIAQGQSVDMDLNSEGVRQAHDLAEGIKNIDLEVIYSSPLKRAFNTAKIVAEDKNIKVEMRDNLKEGDFGVLEGKQLAELASSYMTSNEFQYEEGESVKQMQDRFLSVLDELKDSEFKNIGIASHCGIIKSLLMHLDPCNARDVHNGEVLIIKYKDKKFFIIN